ncbi:FecR family protein [Flavobacterium sp. 7A]|uniref:FecR family protein n=1 Tax=Flavobacterium sp. 7A TaxID=2940571 RepID=UPI0022269EB2|nr:FecR domain-containing protein [Flavobacterium sp. 7A]MCW2118818.1 ferric-dicitrate binding protein FerR (iron transport regulator) [Flavobacterium sp. 7A]
MDIIDLIIKKLHNILLSKKEERFFAAWIEESSQNAIFYKELEVLKNQESEENPFNDVNPNLAWLKVMSKYNKISKKNAAQTFIKHTFKYAAIFIIALSVGYLINNYVFKSTTIIVPKNEVTLESENGTIQVLSSDMIYGIKDAQGHVLGAKSGSKLDFRGVKYVGKLIYNTLKVPYGKKFEITLSDGTLVYLNSGSTFRFPINFIKDRSREVFLEGEGFFEVFKDKKHPFVVNTVPVNVTVLGTKFNVSAYPEDTWATVVLVEGSVELSSNSPGNKKRNKIRLQPGDLASWNSKTENSRLFKVDTDIYTSWIEGRIVFKNQRFVNIIKKLERHYNVKINNNYKELNTELFTATFDVETVEEALNSFAENKPFHFERKQNIITINTP